MTLIKCACGTEGIDVTQDDEAYVAYFSYWQMGDVSHSLLTRLKWCWRILTGRDHWPQTVAIEREQLVDMKDVISSILIDMCKRSKEAKQ